MSKDTQQAADAIRRIVASSGEVLGSRLAMQLKAEVPDWDATAYGVKSLRVFIVTHVDDVIIAGRSGMDVIYAIGGQEYIEHAMRPPSGANLWRVWVSPNSPFILAINQESGAVLAAERHSPVPNGHVLLEPAGVKEH